MVAEIFLQNGRVKVFRVNLNFWTVTPKINIKIRTYTLNSNNYLLYLPQNLFDMLPRYYNHVKDLISDDKVLIIYGSRRVGKTTLLKNLLASSGLKYRIDSGENIRINQILSSNDFALLSEYIEGVDILAIDEAQEIDGIGKGLKILIDHHPRVKLIATGSSSFDLSQKIGEPLTGRKKVIKLFPFSQGELLYHFTKFELKSHLHDYLIFGSYPEVVTNKTRQDKVEIIDELVSSYLLKDILALDKIRNPKVLFNLLKLLSLQVGNLVSINELAGQLHIDGKTVNRYLDLLEKTFIIFKLGSFSSNPRKEITKKSKYYFFDNGIRNGIIMQFGPLELRNDVGSLWENFMVSEFYKKNAYLKLFQQLLFWRNFNGQEIDLIIEKDGELKTFEFKWKKDSGKLPNDFKKKYGTVEYQIINQKNYLEYLKLE
ncbi:MAG TPA: ATP-binding protein [Ignavibacteria bacterium]|nr:ATP-binding protein [Ignavibacteria bacterium]